MHDAVVNASENKQMTSHVCFLFVGNAAENLVPCPCNSSKTCISSWDNGTEMCGCRSGYKRQMDVEGNQMCQGIAITTADTCYIYSNLITS